MSQVWSEINKVVNAYPPKADTWDGDVQSDVVHLENYKWCTFLIMTGSTAADNVNTVTVHAGDSATGAATAIPFRYRSTTATDIYGALTASTAGASFAFTANLAEQFHIVEVDPSDVAAAGTDFDHCAVTITEAGTCGAQVGCIVAILSEPRYPQAVLQTAID